MRLAAIFFFVILPPAAARDFQVTNYGAKGDGKSVDTQAIQKAINAAAAHAGTVTFRPGSYLTGALFLKSGIRFQVGEGVTLLGIQDLSAYPEMPTRVAGIEMTWPAALINVYDQKNVTITGGGTIDGQGKYWWDRYWALRKEYDPKGLRWAADYDCKRVRLIQVYKSSNVILSRLQLHRSGFWTVHLCYSHNVRVDGITIRNNIGGRGPSTDGIDVDSSTHVSITYCDIECNDDAICMKAGRDADGLRVNKPTEDVSVRNCTVRAGAAGITVGSETSGGIRNIRVSGLRVTAPVPKGICFKSAKVRGGTVQDIEISNLDLQGVPTPVSVTLNWNPSYSYAQIPAGIQNVPDYWRKLAQPVPPEKGLPHFRDARISKIRARNAKEAFEVNAYPDAPVENYRFDHLYIDAKSAGTIADAINWVFSNTVVKTSDGSEVSLKNCKNVTGLPARQMAANH
ncbi:MAG: right-handed parallel beta-helix repeat-containing protein [Acidobacteriaceae bacterium]|nr:right-handed parallel beta-helix repeat-containing protein [Acidobacteriaceae bacterium]